MTMLGLYPKTGESPTTTCHPERSEGSMTLQLNFRPLRIHRFNQRDLLTPCPTFDLLFPCDGIAHVGEFLEIYQPRHAESTSEAGIRLFLVLNDSVTKAVRHSCIQRSPFLTRENIHIVFSHCSPFYLWTLLRIVIPSPPKSGGVRMRRIHLRTVILSAAKDP